ncbi:hypothetical protein HPB49_012644 [Dermacentor silvarum]|uniref:Uncharacterized protein n=1 Tax=Dermacentor silvarum TaxID=543639 RepID=A0ACB8C979_DERSI|nr:hypothetical protein HPB49_012644 [Dermacentor silvarum]
MDDERMKEHAETGALAEVAKSVLVKEIYSECTRSVTNPVCRLLRHLSVCNGILWQVGLELREDQDDFGDVRVVLSNGSRFKYPTSSAAEKTEDVVAALLRSLFTLHRCVVAVEVNNCSEASCTHLSKALLLKSTLKRLSISNLLDSGAMKSVFRMISSMKHIDELVFSNPELRFPWYTTLPFCSLARIGTTLTALDVANLDITDCSAKELIALLRKSNTIKSLAVRGWFLRSSCPALCEGFVDYLVRNGRTLRQLTLRSTDIYNISDLETLLHAISDMTALEELNVNSGLFRAEAIAAFAKVLAMNSTLRSLSVDWPKAAHNWTPEHLANFAAGNTADRIHSWTYALRENTVLLKLTVDLVGFGRDRCSAFIHAVSQSRSLSLVQIRNLPTGVDLKELCQTIRTCGLTRMVFIENHYLTPLDFPTLSECQEITSVTLHGFHILSPDTFRAAFDVLATCRHVTTLRVILGGHNLDERLHTSIAEYITGTPSLKNIELLHWTDLYNHIHLLENDSESRLVRALSSNLNLNSVTLECNRLSTRDGESLANLAMKSKALTELTLTTMLGRTMGAFLRSLAPRVHKNYCLLRFRCTNVSEVLGRELATIQNVTSRNSSLVHRAARFVIGDRDTYCARALELVHEHDKVVELVQEHMAVSATEAADMVTVALLGLTCLDGYMRAAGVVKEKVVCHRPLDTSKQLDELDEDCWWYIRKYLKVSDILDI